MAEARNVDEYELAMERMLVGVAADDDLARGRMLHLLLGRPGAPALQSTHESGFRRDTDAKETFFAVVSKIRSSSSLLFKVVLILRASSSRDRAVVPVFTDLN